MAPEPDLAVTVDKVVPSQKIAIGPDGLAKGASNLKVHFGCGPEDRKQNPKNQTNSVKTTK